MPNQAFSHLGFLRVVKREYLGGQKSSPPICDSGAFWAIFTERFDRLWRTSRELPRTSCFASWEFFIFKILEGSDFRSGTLSGRDSWFVTQNRLIRRFSISVHLYQCKRELGAVWNRPPKTRIRVHSAPSLPNRTAMISRQREEYNPDSSLAR